MEVSEKLAAQKIMEYLESNQLEKVDEMKLTLNENVFGSTKDCWPVYGFFDYYMTTGSLRAIEVLLNVKEPHYNHLFDRLSETLKSPQKLKALQFFGYLTKKEPPWLYKIAGHSTLKELLRILKTETEEVIVVNAALVLASLLPIIPSAVSKIFDDICTIFNRLTVWHTIRSSSSQMFLIHLRLAIAALFHRLYGMFPVNFLSYMRSHIGLRDSLVAFRSSLKPLLETVRMNPHLVTATKDSEMTDIRWKGMDTSDILAECYQLVLSVHPFREEELEDFWKDDFTDGLDVSYHELEAISPESFLCDNLQSLLNDENQWFQLTQAIHEAVGGRGGRSVSVLPLTPVNLSNAQRVSTPVDKITRHPLAEKAVEATPETTPYTTPVKELEAWNKHPNPQVIRLSGRSVASRAVLADPHTHPDKAAEEIAHAEKRGSLLSQKLQMISNDRRASYDWKEEGSIVSRKNVSLAPLKIENQSLQGLLSPVKFTEQKPSVGAPEPSGQYLAQHEIVTKEDREVSSVLSPSEPTTPENEECCGKEDPTSPKDAAEKSYAKKFLEEETSDDGASEASSVVGPGSFPDVKNSFPKRRLRYHSYCITGKGSFDEPGVKRQKSFSSPSINETAVKKGPFMTDLNDSISTVEAPEVVYESRGCQTDPETELPVAHLLPFLFPLVCEDSLTHSTSMPNSPAQKYLSVYPTAEESMEKYMEYAIEYHKKAADRHMTTKSLADEWDDPAMLRNQVLLLHTQLLFERTQRHLHVERGRNLAKKLRRANAEKEATKQTEELLREASANIVVLKYELEKIRKQKHSMESQITDLNSAHEHQIKNLQQLLKEAQGQNEMSKNHIHKLTEENKKIKQEIDRVSGQKVDLENSNRFLKVEGEVAAALRLEIGELKHRFLVLGEVNHKLSIEVQSLSSTHGTDSLEMELFKEASRREIAETRYACEDAMREKDAALARIGEMEKQIKEKNTILETIKGQLNEAHAAHLSALKEEKSHHDLLLTTNYQLETEKLYLQQKLEKSKQDMHRKERHSIPITGGRRLDMETGQSPASTGSSLSNHSMSGATGSPSELSISLAMEVSEGFNESHFFNLEGLLKKPDNGGDV